MMRTTAVLDDRNRKWLDSHTVFYLGITTGEIQAMQKENMRIEEENTTLRAQRNQAIYHLGKIKDAKGTPRLLSSVQYAHEWMQAQEFGVCQSCAEKITTRPLVSGSSSYCSEDCLYSNSRKCHG